jgi:hypothetical protein
MAINNINLYNHFHNGDIFYSRVLMQAFDSKFNINYYHSNLNLFEDMDNVSEFLYIPSEYSIHENFIHNNTVNTWIGQNGFTHVHTATPGCSFENYFSLVKIILNHLNIEIKNPEDYLPEINFEKLKDLDIIYDKISSLRKQYKKLILISSGPVHSAQSFNFDFHQIMINICNQNPNVLILSTMDYGNMPENFINTSFITKKIPDLLQISYISKFCDIIIGRASGPFCFCHTKENLLNPDKTFISICNNESEGKWFQSSKALQKWTNNYDPCYITNLINSSI